MSNWKNTNVVLPEKDTSVLLRTEWEVVIGRLSDTVFIIQDKFGKLMFIEDIYWHPFPEFDKWKKSSEELPEENVKVLCKLPNGHVTIGKWQEIGFRTESAPRMVLYPKSTLYWCEIPKYDIE